MENRCPVTGSIATVKDETMRRCDMSKPEVAEHVKFYMFAYPFFTAVGPRRGLQFAG